MIQHAGLGYRRDLAEDFLSLSDDSPIRFIEAAPENWLKMGGRARKQFDRVAERLPLALHGLSMSLGGQAPLDTALIDGIKEMMRRYDCTFFSDHLSYCHDGGHLYDLLPLPFTEEMVQHTARRIREVQDRLGCRIAVENTSYYLHSPLAEMNEVEFLNAVAREADCGIHLDVNNIYVNAVNHGLLSPEAFLENVDAGRVCYIHIAGHDVETPELLIDTHGAAVLPTVWDLLELAYAKLPTFRPPCWNAISIFRLLPNSKQKLPKSSTIKRVPERNTAVQPETSAQYQHRFAQAIREGEAADGLPQDRLNVYIRLIRNNIHSFIDRCYTETLQYFDSEEWGRLKEGFVRDARAQTPYFQEIPSEFLRYCQSLPLSDDLLALMDFEHTQLLAETAQTDSQVDHTDSDDWAYTLSPSAFVRRYQYDVTDELQEAETAVLVWRDKEDDVMYQTLDGFGALLLETLAETPTSLNGLQTMLAEFMPS